MTEYIYVPVPSEHVLDVFAYLAIYRATGAETPESGALAEVEESTIQLRDDLPDNQPVKFKHNCAPAKLERAKVAVKRLDQPFTPTELARAMGTVSGSIYGAIERMLAQGWLTDEGHQGNRRLLRYVPAPEVPLAKREDDPSVTGRGRVNGGGGPVEGTGKRETPSGEIGRIIGVLRKQNWNVVRTGSDHFRATSGPHIVILPATPSDPRSVKNVRAELRRKGAKL
jgi:hypothetical protein